MQGRRRGRERKPAPCSHDRFEEVRLLVTGELVGQVCADCFEPLPADWRRDERMDMLIAEVDVIDARLAKLAAVSPGALGGQGARRLLDRRAELMARARELLPD